MTPGVDLPPTLVSGLVQAAAAIDADGELSAAARGRLHRLVDEAARSVGPDAGRLVRARLARASACGRVARRGAPRGL